MAKTFRKQMQASVPWSSKITALTFGLALGFSTLSSLYQSNASFLISLLIVGAFIVFGIAADACGLAAATAVEKRFHAMASKGRYGAKEAAFISRKAPVFSSFLNDVIGDISGIISGAATTPLVYQLAVIIQTERTSWLFLLLSVIGTSIVAALTVGGKAICKTLAIYHSTTIVLYMGKLLGWRRRFL